MPIIVGYAVLFGLNLWIGYWNVYCLAVIVIGWLFIAESLMRVLTTELTQQGFSQRTLRGRKYIAWAEVESVSRTDGLYWVTGKGLRLLLRPGLFEDPEAARAFIENHLPAGRMTASGTRMNDLSESVSIWLPGKFTPRAASGAERLWIRYCPPGWEYLPYVALLIPGALLEYAIFHGHGLLGAIGWFMWAAILWQLLVHIHQDGRVRIWFSVPLVLLAYLAIGLLIVHGF